MQATSGGARLGGSTCDYKKAELLLVVDQEYPVRCTVTMPVGKGRLILGAAFRTIGPRLRSEESINVYMLINVTVSGVLSRAIGRTAPGLDLNTSYW